MQYGGRDSKTMKGKLLTGVGLLLIAAALLLTVYNIRESDRAGAESEEMVVRMESLTADLPERLETEKKELVPEYIKTYGNSYKCTSPRARNLWRVFSRECERYGILYRMKDIIHAYKKNYEVTQLSLFD